MIRIGAFALTVMALFLLLGCGEKTATVQQTGLEITFPHCLAFSVEIWIDNSIMASLTSQRPALLEVAAGSHTIYAYSNIHIQETDSYYCWTDNFSITEGKITSLVFDCYGHTCLDTP